jgi:TetR/AcrR family fatty acid metabolism transcriptional regulator
MSENSVERIMSASAMLFAERGVAGVSVQELADQAGVAAGTVIYHFKSKNNLLFILARDILLKLHQRTKLAMEGAATPLEAVHTYVDTFFEFATTDRISMSFLTRLDPFNTLDLTTFPNIDLYVIKNQYISLLAECFERGMAQGQFTSLAPDKLGLLVWAVFRGVACLYSETPNLPDFSQEVKRMLTGRLLAAVQPPDPVAGQAAAPAKARKRGSARGSVEPGAGLRGHGRGANRKRAFPTTRAGRLVVRSK